LVIAFFVTALHFLIIFARSCLHCRAGAWKLAGSH